MYLLNTSNTYRYAHMHAYSPTHRHTHSQIHTHTHTHTHTHIHTRTHMYRHTHKYTYTQTHTHIHAHLHTQILQTSCSSLLLATTPEHYQSVTVQQLHCCYQQPEQQNYIKTNTAIYEALSFKIFLI